MAEELVVLPEGTQPPTDAQGGDRIDPGTGDSVTKGAENAAAPPPKPAPRTFKAKVNGKEVELPEDEVIQSGLTAAQIRRAANEQFQQAQRARQEVEAFRQGLQQQGARFLMQQMGPEAFKRMVIEAATEEMKREQMDPAQRALLEERQRREQLEEQVRQSQAQQQQAREEQAAAQYRQQYDKEFGDALTSLNLPKTTETVRRMATLMRSYLQRQIELTPAQAAQMVREDLASESAGTLGQMEGARLIEFLGADVMKKIRAADIARVKGAKANGAPAPTPTPTERSSKQNKGPNKHLLTRDEWLKAMGEDPNAW